MNAGFASVDITPNTGTLLNGFVARVALSTGVDAPLFARSLWLEHGDVRCLIVSLDVLGLLPWFADRVLRELASRYDLPEGNIILASSHTHSGPMTTPMRGIGHEDEEYLSLLAERVYEAGAAASASVAPVRLCWGEAPVELGVNRRQVDPEDGKAVLGRNPEGMWDATVRAMRLAGENSSIILFEHACHPYCLGGEHSLISADFWGHAAATLEEQGHQAIYLNGCAGSIAPRLGFKGPPAARAEGRKLAEAVLEACDRGRCEEKPSLQIRSARLELPYDDVPSWTQLEQEMEEADRTVRQEERQNPVIRARLRAACMEWLDELKEATAGRSALPPMTTRLSVARIGRGVIVALPGDVFFEIGRSIAARLDADPVCVAAYCHDYIGYVPDADAFPLGGYEIEEAHRYVGLWRLSPRAGALLEDQVVRLWRTLGDHIDESASPAGGITSGHA